MANRRVHDGDTPATTPRPGPRSTGRSLTDGRAGPASSAPSPWRPAERSAGRPSEQETVLAQYLRGIAAYALLSRDEERELARRVRAGDADALGRLVCANLRFVVVIAKRYQRHGVPLSDLINEGNLGLLHAARRFDETKGIKFISYAVWWIRQAIFQALAEQSRIVRVPLNRAASVHRVSKRAAALRQELGREATHAEIAEGMDVTEEEVATAMSISRAHLSLDAPLTPGENNRLVDHLADDAAPAPDARAGAQALADLVRAGLSRLTEREAVIVRLYFGLDDEDPLTLDQIGARLGVSRERVRQVREKALARLRVGRLGRALSEFR
jgi:RNA polymerase primary sigma factor